jgi:hypothetical protein
MACPPWSISQLSQQSADMTALYTGEIPVEQVTKHFQLEPNGAAHLGVKRL